MKDKKQKTFLEPLKALSDNTRLNIVLFIASGEKCVCEIFKYLKLPQNLISHHLAVLRKNKLIINRKEGKWVHYSLNRKNIKKIQKSLEEIIKIKEIISKC
ncbi:MAG: metalloregulator ArsR/SmtB family transcription factor [Candidatus Nomurabacteria bacterium]|nr:metalloregulator ArsR/SmtB family transcription factor [Candidatus Nomurabacteria bacterium]